MNNENFKKRKETARKRTLESANKFHRAFTHASSIEDWLRQNMYNRIVFELSDVQNDNLIIKFKAYPRGPGTDETSGAISEYEAYVMRYSIEPKKAIDNLMKFFREKPLNERIIHSPEVFEMKL